MMRYLVLVAGLLLALASPVRADFEEGMRAYKSGEYATALRELRPLAETGNANAQFNLGVMYGQGQGVAQDYDEAIRWFCMAADQGHSMAQFNLDMNHWREKCLGMEQDSLGADDTSRGQTVGARTTGWNALSYNDIRAIQRALNAAGYNAGPVDGQIGPRTRSALEAFQRSKRLVVGEPDQATLEALGVR